MRLTVVIASLARGGAEGVAARLASAWAGAGHQVTLVTFEPPGRAPQQALHPDIQIRQLGLTGASRSALHALWTNLARLKRLRQALRGSRPEAIVAHGDSTNVLILLASLFLPARVFPVEHVDPRHHRVALPWRLLRALTYRRASTVVTVSRRMIQGLPRALRKRARHIWNPVPAPPPGPAPDLDAGIVLGMGRLAPQKGFDLLIRAFAAIANRHPSVRLRIIGEGPARTALEGLCRELGVEDRVSLPGATSTPESALRAGSVFVLSSRYEGFGLVLAEAMAVGLPVIATDCASGPGEILRDGVDGILVPPDNVPALTRALSRLLEDRDLARRYAARAPEVLERFSLERTLRAWDELLAAGERV